MFEPFWYKPEHQPDKEKTVEFELKPLGMRQYIRLDTSYGHESDPAWRATLQDDCEHVFLANVVNWRGFDIPCDQEHRKKVLSGEASFDWLRWVGEIAATLLLRATLKESERKNS